MHSTAEGSEITQGTVWADGISKEIERVATTLSMCKAQIQLKQRYLCRIFTVYLTSIMRFVCRTDLRNSVVRNKTYSPCPLISSALEKNTHLMGPEKEFQEATRKQYLQTQ